MKLSADRQFAAAALLWLPWLVSQAAPSSHRGGHWPPALHVDALAACALLLALLAFGLLWRGQRLRRALHDLQQRYGTEQALRIGADVALLESHAALCQVTAAQQALLRAERQRIAADIHDDLGQHLLMIKMDLCALQARPSLAPSMRPPLELMLRQTELAVRSLRAIICDLRPVALEHGLRLAIERQASAFTRISGIACRLQLAPETEHGGALAAHADCVVFRVVQEALSNIARHACASDVQLILARPPGRIALTVRDNGVGMPDGAARHGWGVGGMEERVRMAGGEYELASTRGSGTTLRISLPLHAVTLHANDGANTRKLVNDQAEA